MLGINVKKDDTNLVIQWQLSTTTIPLNDIIEVNEDETYGGENPAAVRIGTPYGTTDRIVIKTKKQDYLLFTTNKAKVLKEIHS
ncbi:SunI/YnzG family protein [Halalkalibacterium halodurans]|uniref:SunI/YnzG family protein n=1 Tax=Halalkalibacterium halodurans TaxID=86665 RepID=UPI002AA9D39E|nr:hypothetical protein [Halalkalibacterium halodurans]MDY7224557.1 hypothetical protein [Halalkalibacterium halodurans]MDY7243842.1 hypothetical protein [Halalkalibacterium halodurans]